MPVPHRANHRSVRLEDYGLIGDLQTAALVGRNGSIDWLCLPRFDSASCFSALLGDECHGRWLPVAVRARSTPSRGGTEQDTLVLETEYETADGAVRVIDFMTPRRGEAGRHASYEDRPGAARAGPDMRHRARRCGRTTGSIKPWVEPAPDGVVAIAGPDAFRLTHTVAARRRATAPVDGATSRSSEGASERITLAWYPSHEAVAHLSRTPTRRSPGRKRGGASGAAAAPTTASIATPVLTSLITLKAMTYETDGGASSRRRRRRCRRRSAASATGTTATAGCATPVLTLTRCSTAGYTDEALALGRLRCCASAAGDPARHPDHVRRRGRAAADRVRARLAARVRRARARSGSATRRPTSSSSTSRRGRSACWPPARERPAARIERRLVAALAAADRRTSRRSGGEPDDGIWEVRGPAAGLHGLEGHGVGRCSTGRSRLAERVRSRGAGRPLEATARRDPRRGVRAGLRPGAARRSRSTTARESSTRACSNIPLVGFLPGDDERVIGTDRGGRARAEGDGFVSRYSTARHGRRAARRRGRSSSRARSGWSTPRAATAASTRRETLFERLARPRNDVGLLAEEYDVARRPARRELPAGVQPPGADPRRT